MIQEGSKELQTEEQEMFIQGDLQLVFDALYSLGVIDPVLKSDWTETEAEIKKQPQKLAQIISVANACRGDLSALTHHLNQFDKQSLHFLALEVAREFVDYETRSHDLH